METTSVPPLHSLNTTTLTSLGQCQFKSPASLFKGDPDVLSRPLDDGYRIMIFLQKVLIFNDTAGFITVFRPSFLRCSSNMSLFCFDIIMEVFGILGNMLSIYILAQRSLRSSTSLLLSSMAVYDSIFLLTMLGVMLNEVFGKGYYKPTESAVLNTIFQASGMASVFTVVAVTTERYIAVTKPMKARMFCTASAAWKVIAFIICFSFMTTIPRFLNLYRADDNRSSELKDCANSVEKSTLHLIYCSLFPLIFILVIPFLIISVLNASILQGLIRRGRSLKILSGAGSIVNGDKLTFATLGTSSFFFVCCTFPAVYTTIDGIRPDLTHEFDELISNICSSLVILNFSANFIFYCVLGRAFRSVLLDRVCCQSESRAMTSERQTSSRRIRLPSERATSL